MFNPDFSLKNTYVQIYTGEGKGKTTASLGLTVRHLGQGGKVLYTQFCKGDDAYKTGEKMFFKVYSFVKGGKFTFRNFGSKYKWELPENITVKDKIQADSDFNFVFKNAPKYTLVILDELGHAMKCGLINTTSVLNLIEKCEGKTEIVITGRNINPIIFNRAHLITEMLPVRHYWNIGVKARKGIEY